MCTTFTGFSAPNPQTSDDYDSLPLAFSSVVIECVGQCDRMVCTFSLSLNL